MLQQEMGIIPFKSNAQVAAWADLIILAVKPAVVSAVAGEIRKAGEGKAIVSIAAGITTQALAGWLPDCRVARVMPNTPALVGEGMTAVSKANSLAEHELAFVTELFESIGRVVLVDEHQLAAVTALSGSGPAYFFLLIEAMADAGVKHGLPRALAYELAAQTALGAGKMVRDAGQHPGALKDAVCSPGGTTIQAISALENAGARSAMMQAVDACYNKAKEME